MVLILGVGTVLLTRGLDGRADPTTGSTAFGVTAFDPVPADWDVVGLFDAGALGEDPILLRRAVEQVQTVPGVSGIAVVSAEDLGAILDRPAGEGSEIGVVVSTSGDVDAAEAAARQLTVGTTAALTRVVYSAPLGAQRVDRALELLHRNAYLSGEGLLTAAPSGPEPQFETDRLGEEMVLEPANTEALDALPFVVDFPSPGARMTGDPVYLGHAEGVHGFVVSLQDDDGTPVICDMRVVADGSGAMGCNDLRDGAWIQDGRPGGRIAYGAGMSDDPSEPIAISFVALPESVSIVAIDLGGENGRYWQRPIGGSAMFAVLPGRSDVSVTVTLFDGTGGVLHTEAYSFSS